MEKEHDPIKALQQGGHRLTPQRMMVLDAVRETEGHASAEEIFSKVHDRYPYANISTVYRTLELLNSLGLVTETDLGEGRVRYHYAEKGHHHHLVCRTCGVILDVDDADMEPLSGRLLDKHGFRADLRHMAIFGVCRGCAAAGKE